MTDKTDPIAHAARLLREAAQELQQGHTLSGDRNNWIGEPEAKAAYDDHMGTAAALECWAEAIGAGGVSGPLMSCASLAASAGSEPVARVNDDGFIVEIGDLLLAPGQKLYLHPSPPEGMVGWKWVPIEPTHEMKLAGFDAIKGVQKNLTRRTHLGAVWAAMIAAAPPASSADSRKGE